MGCKTTFNYCVNAAAGDCMNAATGPDYVTVTDPDGNTTVYDYDQGTLAAQIVLDGHHADLRARQHPRYHAPAATSGGTLLDTTTTDGDGETTSYIYNADGKPTSATAPGGERPAVHDHNGVHQPGQRQLRRDRRGRHDVLVD